MCHEEYIERSELIKTSAAPAEVREKALENLNTDYYGISQRNTEILREIYASEADTDDINQQ